MQMFIETLNIIDLSFHHYPFIVYRLTPQPQFGSTAEGETDGAKTLFGKFCVGAMRLDMPKRSPFKHASRTDGIDKSTHHALQSLNCSSLYIQVGNSCSSFVAQNRPSTSNVERSLLYSWSSLLCFWVTTVIINLFPFPSMKWINVLWRQDSGHILILPNVLLMPGSCRVCCLY